MKSAVCSVTHLLFIILAVDVACPLWQRYGGCVGEGGAGNDIWGELLELQLVRWSCHRTLDWQPSSQLVRHHHIRNPMPLWMVRQRHFLERLSSRPNQKILGQKVPNLTVEFGSKGECTQILSALAAYLTMLQIFWKVAISRFIRLERPTSEAL